MNDWTFDEFRNMNLPASDIRWAATEDAGRWTVTLVSPKPAFYVWVNAKHLAGEFDDNAFTLLPGVEKKIVFTPRDGTTAFEAFHRSLEVTDLSAACFKTEEK